ncbi:unnamed protein product, partial [Cyprideis torosa]
EALRCGQHDFGENYAQEMVQKCEHEKSNQAVWHFIGPLQSNKTALVAQYAHWCHSIDRLKIARRLSEQRPPDQEPLQVCIEVNIDVEQSKAGVLPEDVEPLAKEIDQLPNIKLRGLMCIPVASDDPVIQRASFSKLRHLQESLISLGYDLDTLSMGMSADYREAIAEGATIVRIGTAIFGERH